MIGTVLLYCVIAIVGWLTALRIIRRYYKFPAPAFIGRFLDSRQRKLLQPPGKLIESSGIEKGMIVMELGCGPGTFCIDVARAVGDEGKLYAVDIQPQMINKLERKLKKEANKGITNIETKVASAYELPLEDGSLNLVYMVAVLQEIPDTQRALEETHRVLREDGTLAVSEFFPDPDFPFRRTTRRICERAGYELVKSSGNFLNYTLQFRKCALRRPY